MKIIVNHPGYWAHGRQYDATRETLHVNWKGPLQDYSVLRSWGGQPADGYDELDCHIVTDPTMGRMAIPATLCREIEAGAA